MMNPDSFTGRIVLNTVDKLVLGVAALVVGLWIQGSVARQQELSEELRKLSRSYVETLTQQRVKVGETVGEYTALLERNLISGKLWREKDQSAATVSLEKVKVLTAAAEAAVPDTELGQRVKVSGDGLVKAMAKTNLRLIAARPPVSPAEMQKEAAGVTAAYAALVREWVEVSRLLVIKLESPPTADRRSGGLLGWLRGL